MILQDEITILKCNKCNRLIEFMTKDSKSWEQLIHDHPADCWWSWHEEIHHKEHTMEIETRVKIIRS